MNGTNTIRRRRSRRSGFTLLEIMLVLGLLALLAALIIPNLVGKSEEAKKNICKSQVGPSGSLAQAVENFKIDCDKWPESLKDLVTKPSDEEIGKKWKGPYVKEVGKDPWDHEYQYEGGDAAKHNEKGFDLWSSGPDGVSGNDDDICNWKKDNEQ